MFVRQGKIVVKYDDGRSQEIVSKAGDYKVITFSSEHKKVIYTNKLRSSKLKSDNLNSQDQFAVRCFDLSTQQDINMFTTCLDGYGGTSPAYANSTVFPPKYLCHLEKGMLSPQGDRFYFQTEGWAVCSAIHYFDFTKRTTSFFQAGELNSITKAGIEVWTTGIDTKEVNGEIESLGRYSQLCLFNQKGKLIKTLGPKE